MTDLNTLFSCPLTGFHHYNDTYPTDSVHRDFGLNQELPCANWPFECSSSTLEFKYCFICSCQSCCKPFHGHIPVPRTSLIRGDDAHILKGKPVYPRPFRGAMVENMPEIRTGTALRVRYQRRTHPPGTRIKMEIYWLPDLVHSMRSPVRKLKGRLG